MALCATMIMRIMARFPWVSYVGLGFLIYLSLHMIIDGWPQAAGLIGIGIGA
jgi:predicted tellurium resistance membrane protein TerC